MGLLNTDYSYRDCNNILMGRGRNYERIVFSKYNC